jgi:hypothetical protein
VLRFVNSKLKSDRDIVSAAISQNKKSIIYASSKLKDDEEFMLKYIREDGSFLRYVSERLYNDKKIILTALKTNANVWLNIYSNLKYDNDILLAAIKQDENIINCFPESYKKNILFMIEAVKVNGLIIKYAPENLKKNINYIYAAVKNNYLAIKYIPKKLQDINIITYTLSYHTDFLQLLGKFNNKYIKHLYYYYYNIIINKLSLKTFIFAMLRKNNILHKLNLGNNFNSYFFKEVNEYLNIPIGIKLLYLHRAYYNLTSGISDELLKELRTGQKCNINIKYVLHTHL